MLSLGRSVAQVLLALLPFQSSFRHISDSSTPTIMATDLDPTTQSNYNQVYTEHVSFDWAIDFESHTISGNATHTLKVKEDGPKEAMCVYYLEL